MAPKCQPGHILHPINIFTSIISPRVSIKYRQRSKEILGVFFGTLQEKNKESLEEDKKWLSFLLSV